MEGGIGRRKRRRRAGSSASRLSYGQWISWDNWLKVSLSVLLLRAVCKWLSGLVLCCVSRVIYQVCREETEGGGEATPVAGQAAVTSLLAGCVNSTSDLYGNRTASTPLLPSWQTVGTRGTDLHFTPLSLSLCLLLGCQALGSGPG